MIPRPMVLVVLLLILVVTSQFEWKQQLMGEFEAGLNISQNQQHILKKEEVLKEKIILLQEKKIQQLNELVQSTQQQLLQCQRRSNIAENFTTISLNTIVDSVE